MYSYYLSHDTLISFELKLARHSFIHGNESFSGEKQIYEYWHLTVKLNIMKDTAGLGTFQLT